MIIMLFGVSNVGKTSIGRELAKNLKYSFYDLDEEIKNALHKTLDKIYKDYPDDCQRHQLKGQILKQLMNRSEDSVIAVSPLNYKNCFESSIQLDNVLSIVLKDTPEHIFDRLVFANENDVIYKDDYYKNEHQQYYLNDITSDIYYYEHVYDCIESQYFINNKSIETCAHELADMIIHHKPIQYTVPLYEIIDNILESWNQRIYYYNKISGHKLCIDINHSSSDDIDDYYLNHEIYIQIPTYDDFLNSHLYEDFVDTVQDIQIKKEIMLRMEQCDYDFDSYLEDYGLLKSWENFQSNAIEKFAIAWCEKHQIYYEI